MRKVVVSEFVSLDGVMEDPGWTFQSSSEEQERFKFDELAASDALSIVVNIVVDSCTQHLARPPC